MAVRTVVSAPSCDGSQSSPKGRVKENRGPGMSIRGTSWTQTEVGVIRAIRPCKYV